ncbi:MAG: helix-turn-helix transcriptional regulator [Candidatus Thorarchaeota archaeon]|nr:helix-turn-helix transcriptional regulator [Candidatus Thorarchaeota archaeon]
MVRTENIQQMVIKLLGNRDLHGYEIHKELEVRGIKLGIGRLYEILNKKHEEGFLSGSWSESPSGPKKRIYSLNSKGREAREAILMDAIHTVHEFYGEYLRHLPTEKSAFTIIANNLAKDIGPASTIAYVSMRFTKPIQTMLVQLRLILPESTIYLVGPRDMANEMETDLPSLEGARNSIPAKDGHFDMLVLPGFSETGDLQSCVPEWARVLKPSGKVVIVTPTVLLKKPDDPMSIGEYIEKHEHPTDFEGMISLEKSIRDNLAKFFEVADTSHVVHISLITATKSI